MLITKQFVYIHLQKTGGTFVEAMLQKVHEARGDRIVSRVEGQRTVKEVVSDLINRRPTVIFLKNWRQKRVYTQHGACSQIPLAHRHKPVLTTIRNPYDRYVSLYEYKNWPRNPKAFGDAEAVKRAHPHYPDVSFEEYVEISNQVWTDKKTNTRFTWEDRLGQQTLQFIEYFYQNPARVTEIDAAYLEKKCYLEDLYPNLHFTFTHDLNRQLYEFLRKMGYAEPEIAFIREHEKVMPKQGGRNEKQNWEKYYTPELKAKVRHHERMLFEMFPEFDV